MMKKNYILEKDEKYMQRIIDNGDGTIKMGKSTYNVSREPRGCREKIWIHDSDNNRQATNYRNSNLLIKFNRNDVSCENYGEILYYAFLKSCGARCTKYELAELCEYDGEQEIKHSGVICPTYMHRENEFEFSGLELQRYQSLFKSSENKKTEPNTISEYIECIRDLMMDPKEEMLNQIKKDLIIMAFFDYITCQSDRHWGNVSFVFRAQEIVGHFSESLRVASSYDNGCSFMFNRKMQALETIASQLKVAKHLKDTDRHTSILERISNKSVPCLGIKTSVYNPPVGEGDDYPSKLQLNCDENWEEAFLNELCAEIIKDKQLVEFFRNKDLFKIDNARPILEEQGDIVPEPLMYLAGEIVDYRADLVFKTLEKYKNSELLGLKSEELRNGKPGY